ncbi:uncharacterized protein F4822DRAFT_421794 [Hypoxylon trugodes]|uniref:uncharacterized protein n=1 Tax=Hypoxylon trugodes TaxID=326681 RepID=UPI00219FECA0|nr:uncharacterized protein F4822DRAFT_421794 [Hypoxylon trugodes]KAI1382994.1 hypothetical protein F4822DRAFT_421794 [Hypoxylon trugodes]
MSRNVRQQRPPTTPVKGNKRRGSDASSSLDLSDEGGYSGVDDISDSEDDDEEDVNAAEEEHILSDELQQIIRSSISPRPHESEDEQEEEEEEDDDDEEDDYEGDDDDADENASWDGISSEADADELGNDQGYTSTERRVRFDIPEDSSDGDSTETDDDIDHGFFPDLFVDKSILDPSFRREIEHDPDPYDSSNSEAFWDHYGHGTTPWLESGVDDTASDYEALIRSMEEDDSTPVATPMTSHELSTAMNSSVDSSENDEVSLDGYQTDGDTTDEEDPPEKPVRRKTRREVMDDSSDSDVVTLIRPRRGQPRIGRFNLDKSSKKPIAILNPRTGKMMIFTHQCMRGRGFDLSPEQFNFQYFEQAPSTPILSNPGNIMMSGMISSSTYGDFMNTHTVGPAEAWYSQASDGNAVESSDSEDQVVDEAEKSLKLEDFITLDDDEEEEESSEGEKGLEHDEGDDQIFFTPNRTPGRPNTASSDVTSLLEHFEHNTDIVGAFRRDQANHRLISRSKATRDSLAFSGPYYEGTLRGIKDGRIATTNVPISPMRKQKKMMPELTSSPLATMSQKRKASSEHHLGHKRQRSIPDVDLLKI